MQPYEPCEHTSSFAKKLTKSDHQRDFCASLSRNTPICPPRPTETLSSAAMRSFNADPGRRYDLSFSVGIVSSDATQHSDIEHLLSQADALMYRQKPSKKDSRGFLTASP